MNEGERLIGHFYRSFQQKNYAEMAACYHPDAVFSDPVFDLKNGREIAAMWHFLCVSGKDLQIEFGSVRAGAQTGSAHWEARYTFSRTGKKVHNVIDADFAFLDGKIIRHRDVFSFPRWARQAFGLTGWLLGGTPFLRNKVRDTAMKGLFRFIEQHPEYRG